MIAIDFIVASFPGKYRTAVSILMQSLGLVVVVFFAYQATLWLLRPEVRLELSPTTQLPVWYNYTMFPFAFYGMTFHLAVGLATMVTSHKAEE